jgi:four helix bundle protein
MDYVKNFRELKVYKLSREISKEVYRLSIKFPKEETYSLTDQVRRSSRSVGAQISEAWAKRSYEKHFVSKLTDADGELETQHWIETALDCSYMTPEDANRLLAGCSDIGKMLNSMTTKASTFCKKQS